MSGRPVLVRGPDEVDTTAEVLIAEGAIDRLKFLADGYRHRIGLFLTNSLFSLYFMFK